MAFVYSIFDKNVIKTTIEYVLPHELVPFRIVYKHIKRAKTNKVLEAGSLIYRGMNKYVSLPQT